MIIRKLELDDISNNYKLPNYLIITTTIIILITQVSLLININL